MELGTKLVDIFRLTDIQKAGLRKLSLGTVEDLLRYVPSRYVKSSQIRSIAETRPGEQATLEGALNALDFEKTWKKKLNIAKGVLKDNTGEIALVWFHQPYIARILKDGDLVRVQGKVGEKNGRLFIPNPIYEKVSRLAWRGQNNSLPLLAVYPETRGISSRWIVFHVQKILESVSKDFFRDPLPREILERYHLPNLGPSLRAVHFPKSERECEAAKKRLSFEEIFYIQLSRIRERMALEEKEAPVIQCDKKALNEYLKKLPFSLTRAQSEILNAILKDLSKNTPMARLLEGDVGSGKTVIAAGACYMAAHAHCQSTYMAPTEILARQHFDSFAQFIASPSLKIGLLTSSEARVYPSKAFRGQSAHIPKSQLQRWAASGEIAILIGTHALLSEKIRFRNLGFIVVDEQHRFGVAQRRRLARSTSERHEALPHFLSMTATPIPRTLALTVFGDLDLSVLDEVPPGRVRIKTEVLLKPQVGAWSAIGREIEKGRQAFVICPRIEIDENSEQKSVKEEYKKISEQIFPQFKVAMLHGKMTPREKEKIMTGFREGSVQILVATSLIEVGIDVPNATIMIVEGADRFGLAQLHQLRGRIGRGEHESFFYAITDSASRKTALRLKALKEAKNGFELAEYDLRLRGPGELTGKNQWGMSDLGMEALKNIKMVEAARQEAHALLEKDPQLLAYPHLEDAIRAISQDLYHFE